MASDTLKVLNTTRQSSLLQSFLDALTRGGPNGLPRPIEIHAHDPIRYVGDMLAWVHQATASEHEFLEGLFGVKERRRMVGQAREFRSDRRGDAENEVVSDNVDGDVLADEEVPADNGEDEERLVSQCLDRHLDGLGRPLKVSRSQGCADCNSCAYNKRSNRKKASS